jgi:hypothetical protein
VRRGAEDADLDCVMQGRPVMVGAIRRLVRQFPVAVVGIVTLLGTGVTTVLAMSMYEPVREQERISPQLERTRTPVLEREQTQDERAMP